MGPQRIKQNIVQFEKDFLQPSFFEASTGMEERLRLFEQLPHMRGAC